MLLYRLTSAEDEICIFLKKKGADFTVIPGCVCSGISWGFPLPALLQPKTPKKTTHFDAKKTTDSWKPPKKPAEECGQFGSQTLGKWDVRSR